MLPGALGFDLGKQEPTASRQTVADTPTPQHREHDDLHRWSADWSSADAAMSTELLIALGIPLA